MKGPDMGGLMVTSLQLSHFRNHAAARLELDGRPVVITGPNGVGKTNILEAFSLLSPGRGLRLAGADELARRPEMIGWKIRARIHGLTGAHEIETWAQSATPRRVRIDDKNVSQTALGRILRVIWLVPSMDRLWTGPAEGRRHYLDRVTLSFFPDHGQMVLDYDKAMRERNRLLRDQSEDFRWYQALESRMETAGQVITANRQAALRRIEQAQAAIGAGFPRAGLLLVDPEPATPDLAAALARSRKRDMAAGRSLIGPHRTDLQAIYQAKGVPAALCSTGEQKAMLINLILSSACALADDLGAAPILLLDEVSAHLDPDRRAMLYDEIRALGAQALMTGTDPALFAPLGDQAQRFAIDHAARIAPVCG